MFEDGSSPEGNTMLVIKETTNKRPNPINVSILKLQINRLTKFGSFATDSLLRLCIPVCLIDKVEIRFSVMN